VKVEMNYDTLRAVGRWMQVRADEGHVVTPGGFAIDAEHSMRGGLLERLIEGKEPLAAPPPCAMSRPWYGLFDAGDAGLTGGMEIWDAAPKGLGEYLVIWQTMWVIVERRPGPEYVVAVKNREGEASARHPRFICTFVAPKGDGMFDQWHLRPEPATP
jgi:hypothetical protein